MVDAPDPITKDNPMNYPLAHDENGAPLDVPGTAHGWLVRRHAGGRGRPAAIYDADGRPLVVPLDATAQELGSHGCRPGVYRLDAVDSARRNLGVAAYTEVRRDGFQDDESPSGAPSDAAVAALARAVEAMQRVQAERERAQAERERAQAEMIARLIERLAPPLPTAPRNAGELLREHSDVRRQIEKLMPESEDDSEPDATSPLEMLAASLQPLINMYVGQLQAKAGIAAVGQASRPSPAATAGSGDESSHQRADDGPQRPADDRTGDDDEPPKLEDDAVQEKLARVFALLSGDEADQVRGMIPTLPPFVVDQAIATLLTKTPEVAAAEVRAMLATLSPASAAPAARQGVAS